MSKILNVPEKPGLASDAEKKPWTTSQYEQDYQNKLETVLRGVDAGKNKEMDKTFCVHVMEASVAGKLFAQKSGKSLDVPDISFDARGVMQVDMVHYDPKEDVPARSAGKRLTAQKAPESAGYGDVALDMVKRNPVSGLIGSAKALSKGDVGSAVKQAVSGVPVVNACLTAKQAMGVHQDRVSQAEAMQKRVLSAAGLTSDKESDMEF